MELCDIYDEHRQLTGRIHARGAPLREGEYRLIVHVWIQNDEGQYLVSKRTPNKSSPNQWECTGGGAVAGEDSLTAALREVKEELGIELDPNAGWLVREIKGDNAFVDVWLFRQDVDLADIVFHPRETCDAKWVNEAEIIAMMRDYSFVWQFSFGYMDKLFAFARRCD